MTLLTEVEVQHVMSTRLKPVSAALTIALSLGLTACSEDTPPLPPAIPAATLDVIDIYDETTDLARAYRADNMYGVPETWYETAKSIYDAYMSDYPYEDAEKWTRMAEAGDADAQFELSFWVATTGQFNLDSEGIGSHTPDRCQADYWRNEAAQQKHAPALTWKVMAFLGTSELGNNRRLATFYFWTWSQLRGFGIKNYKTTELPALTDEEFRNWSEEFKSWDITTAISIEPKSCPGCKENCVTVVETSN